MGRPALKGKRASAEIAGMADILHLTAARRPATDWATHPAGRAVRAFIAGAGMVTATLVLMTATLVSSGSWVLVILGVGLAATSIRAARIPTVGRLATVAAALVAIPLSIQIF